MKKLIATLFTTALMSAGLVVATTGTASANCTPSQYSGCVQTKTKATGPGVVARGKKAKICATVDAKRSNATPSGSVKFKIKRNAGGYYFGATKSLNGSGKACVKTTKLFQRGGYNVDVKYKSPNGSIFINSFGGTAFDVVS